MLKRNKRNELGRLLLGTIALCGMIAPAASAEVYSWITEDGTYAFTDDPKRIPAKHRGEATRRDLGSLDRYGRYTPVAAAQEQSYAERILERRDALRAVTVGAPQGSVVGGLAGAGTTGLTLPVASGGSGARSNPSLWVPVEGAGAAGGPDDAPLVFESKRMDDPGRQTTRHWTFVTRGDKVVTVIKGEHRQRGLTERVSENDFDYWDPEEDR